MQHFGKNPGEPTTNWELRLACEKDIPALEVLIPLSVRALQAAHYSPAQMEAALGPVFGVDRQLILDGTYFVVGKKGQITGCGGWSRRKAMFGGDRGRPGDVLLDPKCDAARIRAFFVHPAWVRRGLGSSILAACEVAIRAAGFQTAELVATLSGEPLYAAFDYTVVERYEVPMADGLTLPVVRMSKRSEHRLNLPMQRLGKNHGGYHGETIDIRTVLRDAEAAARKHGWASETFGKQGEFNLLALRRSPPSPVNSETARIYISAGIHGDEPAGPLAALRLIQENNWPANLDLFFCPCLNPMGYVLHRRENDKGIDLNRDYRNPQTAEVRAHIVWLEHQPQFDLYLCLHEDWESHGFYLYEQNPDKRPSFAEKIIAAVAKVCPIDLSETIEGRKAHGGIIRPNLDPLTRPQWAEAFYLIMNKSRQGYTLEAPSDFPLETRLNALVAGLNAALAT